MVRQRVYEDGGMSDTWLPLTIDEVQDRFARFDADWWIAGGHAIDLFVGWVTRPHDDIASSAARSPTVISPVFIISSPSPH